MASVSAGFTAYCPVLYNTAVIYSTSNLSVDRQRLAIAIFHFTSTYHSLLSVKNGLLVWTCVWIVRHLKRMIHVNITMQSIVFFRVCSFSVQPFMYRDSTKTHADFFVLTLANFGRFLPRDAQCALRGIATVSRPFVWPSVCNVEVPWSCKLDFFENNYANN